ncbi:heme ABC exporter ATP-binding protein CcmA [Marinovum sp. 2_MG-2023]|uniref:heme ABC exporter ATP-binding protein CcmA n=1 Tax=Roseobacteraceae TaxID=2854170 RepID=UPI001FD5FA6C|nr:MULTISPECIES: heme ABC exporter ATP-binding protein CcmA [Roseobacteraceae]MCJ7873784.1 heme ABC exporter ATP-binding protein CcmA [Phaeobacter sp. J2-8]MDO6731063.1 heme ABC exporter ATP-binding protein CcmA [Marinovum sp. 2_MG-2023]MDO6778560.1 heme ABC exporter ATP-binding protein CcmA [Marinovum sp. 1_MG-2023]
MMLDAQNLSVARGGIPILAEVSFSLAPGRALILRGPNGIGKTSLLRVVAGLQPPLAGTLTGAGDNVAYAAHADGLKTTLSVAENLTFWARVFGTDDIAPALAAYQLGPLRDRAAGQLSAGQKRRLGLARLMVTGRPIWVLDEPTVSLDRDAVAMFADAVRLHLGQGGSALIATHIDLGLDGDALDVAQFRAVPPDSDDFDEVFL